MSIKKTPSKKVVKTPSKSVVKALPSKGNVKKKTTQKPIVKKANGVTWAKTKTDIRKKNFLEALEKSLGVITTACSMIGLHRSVFYQWMNDDPEFRAKVESIDEIALDYVESKLFNLIDGAETLQPVKGMGFVKVKDAPNVTAVIFYLKTKGKNRGYSEKHILDVTNTVRPDLSHLSVDELQKLISEAE